MEAPSKTQSPAFTCLFLNQNTFRFIVLVVKCISVIIYSTLLLYPKQCILLASFRTFTIIRNNYFSHSFRFKPIL